MSRLNPRESIPTSKTDDDSSRREEVQVDEAAPFIHKFETDRSRYVYDVNTRRIARVSPVVWDIIEDFGRLKKDQILRKYASRYKAGEISAALESIASTRKRDGLFLSFRPKQITSVYDQDRIRQVLSSKRMQIILNVTEDCNFRCSYCIYGGQYANQRIHAARHMQWDIARPAIGEFLTFSGDSERQVVSFYGGEPLLNLMLIKKCVKHVRNHPSSETAHFSLTTNGSLLAGRTADFLASEQFIILVSLDGPANIHNRHRQLKNGRPTWEQVTTNLRNFLNKHPEYRNNGKLNFNAVIAPGADLLEIEEFFASCDLFTGEMNLRISVPSSKDAPCPESIPPIDQKVTGGTALHTKFINNLKSGAINRDRGNRAFWVQIGAFEEPLLRFHKRTYLTPHLPEITCPMTTCVPGERRLFVSVDGDYFPCERVLETDEMKIGDIRNGVDVPKAYGILERWIDATKDQCRACWCLSACNVGCFASVNEGGRITPGVKRAACVEHCKNAHQRLIQYCSVLESAPKAFDYMAEMTLV